LNVSRKIKISEKEIEIQYLGEFSEIKQGIATGENSYYVSVLKAKDKTYKIVDPNLILKNSELNKIRKDSELKKQISDQGISKKMFSGRTFVPYDKGGTSEIESKRLSNYFSPTNYYIDWSEESINRMKKFTVEDVKKHLGKTNITTKNKTEIASRLLNTSYFFRKGLTFSFTGIYSPTFRINSNSVFQDAGSSIFTNIFSPEYLLGILCSKLSKYLLKSFVNNSINSSIDSIKMIPVPIKNEFQKKIEIIVEKIIDNQKKNPEYEYQFKEQIDIDYLVYQSYGLKNKQINEIENWYDRKYPKLMNENQVKIPNFSSE
jgi:hypothetical protein